MINLGTSNGYLFARLGAIFHAIELNQTFQATTLDAASTAISTQFTTRQDMIPGLQATVSTAKVSENAFTQAMSNLAKNVLVATVQEDSPQPAMSLAYAIPELIRQMNATSSTVEKCTVTATSTTGTNTGTGAIILSVTDETGLDLENMLAESFDVVCVSDALPGSGATAGQERFTAQGDMAETLLSYDWPAGSGGRTSLTSASADISGTAANALVNSNFETWGGTSNGFTSWTATTGTYDTTIGSSVGYTGTYALAITGNNSQLTKVYQTLRSPTVAGIVRPLTKYALAFWSKVSAVPSGGVLRVAIKDAIGGTILGSISVTLSGETTNWALHSTTFNTPLVFPATIVAVIELTTALENAKVVSIDNVVLTQMVQHQNGPYMAIIPGSVNFLRGDKFTITTTNDRAGKFQEWFNRCFNMDKLGYMLPSSASPTIPDSLIA